MSDKTTRSRRKRKSYTTEEFAKAVEEENGQNAQSLHANSPSKHIKEANDEQSEKTPAASSSTSKNSISTKNGQPLQYLYENEPTKIPNNGVKQLIAQGYKINTSPFTPAEDRIIQKNMKEFTEKYKKPVNWLLGFNMVSKDRERREFLQSTKFYKQLARGLSPSRLLDRVRKRARIVCNEYYVAEKQSLSKELAQKFRDHLDVADQRKKFVEISEKMHISPFTLSNAYKYTRVQKGDLTKEDKNTIQNAVIAYCHKNNISVWGRDMKFQAIASGVPQIDCVVLYQEWVKRRVKLVHKSLPPLITILFERGVEHYEDIDWKSVIAASHDLQMFTQNQVKELFQFALNFFLKEYMKDNAEATFRKTVKRMQSFYSSEEIRNRLILSQMPRFKMDRKAMESLEDDS